MASIDCGDAAVYTFGLIFPLSPHLFGGVCFIGGVARVLMSCSGALPHHTCVGVFALLAPTPSLFCQMRACESGNPSLSLYCLPASEVSVGSLVSRVIPCIVSMRWF